MCKHKIFTLDDWTKKHIEPVIKNIDKIIEATHPQDCSRELVKLYWTSFAQNSANLFIMISQSDKTYMSQIMMTFRLLQEVSADIFYLKNHQDKLNDIYKKVNDLNIGIDNTSEDAGDGVTLRHLAEMISSDNLNLGGGGTNARVKKASKFFESSIKKDVANDLGDIYKFLNGYSHFNPIAISWQYRLSDKGAIDTYTKILCYYPAWLYITLVSVANILNIKELNDEHNMQIISKLKVDIEELNRIITSEHTKINYKEEL